jgi:hypothetical protein
MKKAIPGIFLIAFVTLLLQLSLIRVLDVIWHSNMAYMIITLALFSFGISGVYYALNPLKNKDQANFILSRLGFLYSLSILFLYCALNYFPFKVAILEEQMLEGLVRFVVFYLGLALPFFFAGLLTTIVFSAYTKHIQKIYFWDLAGAALGTITVIPLVEPLGGGGLIVFAAALALLISSIFSTGKKWTLTTALLAMVCLSLPFIVEDYLPSGHPVVAKRGIENVEQSQFEVNVWDPISKIDVVEVTNPLSGRPQKHVYYDGGSQSTYIYPFDGDLEALRAKMPEYAPMHFWERHVILSHFLKQDSGQKVLVIGSAGGQEIKGALTYNAASVDGVELVSTVVNLMSGKYAEYNGGITIHPNVNNQVGEGRSFLRLNDKAYDIIQIFSNHTSSSIAAGNGAMAANYLQTVEAYESYFSHLSEDGILHINHHVYPRMITTAARAWKKLGRTDFAKHVMVWEAAYKDGAGNYIKDNLPALLIKNSPWTEDELASCREFFGGSRFLRINPIHPEENYLSPEFFTGEPLPPALEASIPYRISAVSDNDPYFNFLRKSLGPIEVDHNKYTNPSVALLLNSQIEGWIPNDVIHIVISIIATLVFSLLFLLVPLFFSKVGREKWKGKPAVLVYFSMLGAGFIIFEIIFIQLFMRLIGYPLYTYTTVVFTMLLAAGIGSYASGKFKITQNSRWIIPFAAVGVYVILFLFSYSFLFENLLLDSTLMRVAIAFILIFPLGFFLGMPFPMGCLELERKPDGGIAWAWAMNGLFTTAGGFGSVLISIYFGFTAALLFGVLCYVVAGTAFKFIKES